MKKLLIFILCCFVGGVKAQSFCEVDSVYKNLPYETGYKIIQVKDGNFVSFSFSRLTGQFNINYPRLTITKFDKCGDTIWRFFLDSNTIGTQHSGEISDVYEQEDSSIVFCSIVRFSGSVNKFRIYKVNSFGQLLWLKNIGNENLDYYVSKFSQINKNRFLIGGSLRFDLNLKGAVLILDSLGNLIDSNIFNTSSSIIDFTRTHEDTILFLAVDFGELKNSKSDDSLILFKMDFDLNIEVIRKLRYFKDSSINQSYIFNPPGNGLTSLSYNNGYDTLIIRQISLTGIEGKEVTIIGKDLYSTKIKYFNDKSFVLTGQPLRIYNDTLTLNWVEDNLNNQSRTIFDAVITSDSIILAVGRGPDKISSWWSAYDFWFGIKKAYVNYVRQIQIQGNSFINQNSGTIQLSAQILPATATNKIINWSIDDTSKAFITQTGFLTAKANGVVKVVAKTTDGSNLSASKQITITNQGLGLLNEDLWSSQVNIFPNPASTSVTVESKMIKIYSVEIIDLYGKCQGNYKDYELVYIGGVESGYYVLKIETEMGILFKKLIIKK